MISCWCEKFWLLQLRLSIFDLGCMSCRLLKSHHFIELSFVSLFVFPCLSHVSCVICEVSHSITYCPTLTHWGRVTHICVNELTTIGSNNGLAPSRRQAIVWTYAGTLLIRSSGTNLNELLIETDVVLFKKMDLKMWCAKCRPFCLGLNMLNISRCVPDVSLKWYTAHPPPFACINYLCASRFLLTREQRT